MAEKPHQDPEIEKDSPPDADQPKRRRMAVFLEKLSTRKWLAIILGVSVVVHAIGFGFYKFRTKAPTVASGTEFSLGDFQFTSSLGGQVAGARFSLHVALLEEVNQAARTQLASHAFRVQQDIEELLRCAHSEDFDDPVLAELKLQLQERINKTLGIRAIAEVIITDLEMDRAGEESATITETAESAPWMDASSS